MNRFRSLTEIEKYDSDIKIPLFDKESADFCFKKSREILSRPFIIDIPAKDNEENIKTLGKQNRNIGENLLDIENTLKALNLDFLHTYNELEKTDSAETLFAEQFARNNSSSNKLNKSSLQSFIADFDFSNFSSKADTNISGSSNKSEKMLQQHNFTNCQIYTDIIDKLEEKRASTPDTGFASRETNLSLSRRSSQRSNFSPQDSYFGSKDFNFPTIESRYMNLRNEVSNSASTGKVNSSPVKNVNTSNNSIHSQNTSIGDYSSRQRSMSFTDNYELKSPVLSEPQHRINRASNFPHRNLGSFHSKPLNVISYKPRSIKARTLRRLSYNPMIMNSSTSSSSESDYDCSVAHSECDIRSKMTVSSRKRRQYLNRKSSVTDEVVQDKMYGSNTSIKSAPHYNYVNERHPQKYQNHQQFNYDMNFEEKIYDFGGRGPGNNYGVTNTLIKPPRAFAMNGSKYERENLFSEFDVSKLTGKSPTTHNFYNSVIKDGFLESKSRNNVFQKLQPHIPVQAFQWPEKIHASTVKQNDLLWRQQQANAALFSNLKVRQAFSSESSSSETDEIEFRRDFQPRIPPSPAP